MSCQYCCNENVWNDVVLKDNSNVKKDKSTKMKNEQKEKFKTKISDYECTMLKYNVLKWNNKLL